MRKIELKIVALTPSVTHTQNYAVVLEEAQGGRRLPIVIGGFEAQAIAVAMENMVPSRPLTHDLFKNALETFDVELKEIVINNLLDGIFYSRLVCIKGDELVEIDSRTSDAIAMAIRFNCPIYTFEFVLDSAGIELEEEFDGDYTEENGDTIIPENEPLSELQLEELENLLKEVLEDEDYERAAEIRDEINKRKK